MKLYIGMKTLRVPAYAKYLVLEWTGKNFDEIRAIVPKTFKLTMICVSDSKYLQIESLPPLPPRTMELRDLTDMRLVLPMNDDDHPGCPFVASEANVLRWTTGT